MPRTDLPDALGPSTLQNYFFATTFLFAFSDTCLYVSVYARTLVCYPPAMKIPKQPTLIARLLAARVKAFKLNRPFVAASLVAFRRKCGRPGCRCQSGEGHLGHHLTFKVKGQTRSVYVPTDLLPEVQQWVREHQRLKPLLQHISQLALAQIRSHAQTKRRKAGRS